MYSIHHRFAAILVCILFASGAAVAVEDVPPPPSIDEAGTSAKAESTDGPPTMDKPAMPDTRPVRDKATRMRNERAEAIASDSDSVTQRQEGGDSIREYRRNGKLRMIRIKPAKGPEQIYFDQNGDGLLDRDPLDGPVAPVYFTIYEWN